MSKLALLKSICAECAAIAITGSLLSLFVSTVLDGGFDLTWQKDNYSRMTVKINSEEALQRYRTNALFIDASAPESFKNDRIKGAINIPWESGTFEAIKKNAEKIKNAGDIVIYDSSFSRQNLVEMADYFQSLQYDRHIFIFEQGLNYWKIAGYDQKDSSNK